MTVQCAWCKRFIGQKAPYTDRAVTHGICEACAAKQERETKKAGTARRVRQAGARAERKFFGLRGVMARYKKNPIAVYGLANPHGRPFDATGAKERELYAQEQERFHKSEMEVGNFQVSNPVKKRQPSLTPHLRSKFVSPKYSRRRPTKAKRYTTRENPARELRTTVAGVVYNRCLEVRAEKTGYQPGLYRHPFSRKSGVQILALDNGDLLLHSTRGVKLWGTD